jgi:SAM-dependent methyltransferase/GT2 family glycosyltransferase
MDSDHKIEFPESDRRKESPQIEAKIPTRMLKPTGERLLPWVFDVIPNHYEHLQRYRFAAQFVNGCKVLDLGCGEGYGSDLLAETAQEVTGLDIDSETTQWASSKYIRPNLRYLHGSALEVPIEEAEAFDVIVCFELLEHVEEKEQLQLLLEVKRLLKRNGLFIISTPSKLTYSDQPEYCNPFHKKELYLPEFRHLLERFFSHVAFLGQKVYVGSAMWPLGLQADPRGVITHENFVLKDKEQFVAAEAVDQSPMYFLAVASNSPLPKNVRNLLSSHFFLFDLSDSVFEELRTTRSEAQQYQAHLLDELTKSKAAYRKLEEAYRVKEEHVTRTVQEIQVYRGHLLQELEEFRVDAERMRHWRGIRRKFAPEGSIRHRSVLAFKRFAGRLFRAQPAVLQAMLPSQPEPPIVTSTEVRVAGSPGSSPRMSPDSSADISIVILARNEARNLARSLPLITEQKLQKTFEIIGIDTESEDQTVELFKRYGARTFTVSRKDFHHVRTRLFALDQTRAPLVVFLVADALPVNSYWLHNLVQPLLEDPAVGAAYSRQLPAPGCVPWEARDIFRGGSVVREVKQVDWSQPVAIENYRNHIWKFIAFSDVSSCYRKELLRALPIPEGMTEVEDQYWCKCLLEKGYRIVLEPTSLVIHSHNDSMRQLYRRQLIYGRCFAAFVDVQPESMLGLLFHSMEDSVSDFFFLMASREAAALSKPLRAIQIPIMRFLKRLGFRQGLHQGAIVRRAAALTRSQENTQQSGFITGYSGKE